MPSVFPMKVIRKWKPKSLKVSKAVQKYVNKKTKAGSELNYVTSNTTGNTPTNVTPIFVRISGTAQGDSNGNRSGNSINCHKLNPWIRYTINAGQVGITFVRTIIFQDMDQVGVVPTGAMLLQDFAGSSDQDYLKHINRVSQSPARFRVLKDYIVKLDPETTIQTAAGTFTDLSLYNNYKVVRNNIKMGDRTIHYIGTANNQASDGRGSCYVAFFTNVATNGPAIDILNEMQFHE